MDRIDPHKDSMDRQKLLAHLIDVNGWLGVNADRRQLIEDAMKAVVRRCRRSASRAIGGARELRFYWASYWS